MMYLTGHKRCTYWTWADFPGLMLAKLPLLAGVRGQASLQSIVLCSTTDGDGVLRQRSLTVSLNLLYSFTALCKQMTSFLLMGVFFKLGIYVNWVWKFRIWDSPHSQCLKSCFLNLPTAWSDHYSPFSRWPLNVLFSRRLCFALVF